MSLDDLPVERLDDGIFVSEEEEHARQVREAREQMAAEEAPITTTPDPAVLAAEQAEADRIRALGPEPHPEITPEMRANNPSDYHPQPDETIDIRDYPPNPSVIQVPQDRSKASAADTRQRWICIGDTGIRTGHPAFRSDAHHLGQMVHCPECDGIHVRKVAPDEVLAEDGVPVTS